MRLLVLALVVLVPLTAFLAFATGDALVPHPWSKQPRHSQPGPHAAVKLPSAVTATGGVAVFLPLLGRSAAATPAAVASTVLRPPFVPPRA